MKQFVNRIKKITNNVDTCEKCIIKLFLDINNINYNNSKFFVLYFSNIDSIIYNKIKQIFISFKIEPSILSLVEIFEMLIPEDEKKNNGIVYTPDSVKQLIIHYVMGKKTIGKICDPSCGCGSFLISCAIYLHKTYQISYKEVFEYYIYGIDISEKSIIKAQILFRFIMLLNNENDNNCKYNLKISDSLNKQNNPFKNIKFDYVVGNPPYVRSKNIENAVKKNLKTWKTSESGNVDLYIPFFELGLNLLKTNGTLGYITPNTYLQSVNGRALRNYLKDSNYHIRIIDYKDNKIFKKATNYTAVTIISKDSARFKITYMPINNIEETDNLPYVNYDNSNFKYNQPWKMCGSNYLSTINIINQMENKLGKYKIKNGLATLKNDIYFFTPVLEDEQYYY
ncbi:MAG: N-6 DNA methylase, partial [Bacteroides sp.]|nr:N-6 DNA methylase [Bacteroides sp.]